MNKVPQAGLDMGAFYWKLIGYMPTIWVIYFTWIVLFKGQRRGEFDPIWSRGKTQILPDLAFLILMWLFNALLQVLVMWIFGFGFFG